ncbi:MAG: DUF2203 family protein [Planctomycetota bacterium]|nr:MAG: DUF2203 family protein [Planctomycetota bacterium]REJ94849.1 MAG: DUF2203 family protein [Planctomycetota bacterium]REK25523.1 MAG: DUF2203 family protein [Planctomycetota bacterium]REK45954.1 MAG: DUF2203 family protein [Planctomycetota bacterium]
MSLDPKQFKRLFTVEEANATLPLVRAICNDMSQLSKSLLERRERLAHLAGRRATASKGDRNDPYLEELAQVEQDLALDSQRLEEYVEELRDLGVEPKDAPRGLVDFPSLMDDRVVFLCWQLGESEVLYWHEVEDGFLGRQPLTAESAASDDSFDGTITGE